MIAVRTIQAHPHRPAVERIVEIRVARPAQVDDRDMQVVGLVNVSRPVSDAQCSGIGDGAAGLQVVVDVVSAHVRVHVDELLRRDLRVQQGLQPILDAHGIQWAVRKAIAERLFDRPPGSRRAPAQLRQAVVPERAAHAGWVGLRVVDGGGRDLSRIVRRREQRPEQGERDAARGHIAILDRALVGRRAFDAAG